MKVSTLIMAGIVSAGFSTAGNVFAADDSNKKVIDNMDDVNKWTVKDPELKTELSSDKKQEGSGALKLSLKTDFTKGKNSKYPIGWPAIERRYHKSVALNFSGYKNITFWLFVDSKGKLPADIFEGFSPPTT